MSGVKKGLMLLIWRFQQVNSMVIIVGLSMSLTFQVFPYVKWRFYDIGFTQKLEWMIMLILFVLIFFAAVICGIIYDVVLKLWIEQTVVNIERQPYAKEKVAAKGILNKRYFFIPMMRKAGLDDNADFITKWVERNVERDKILRKDVNRVIAWINEYELQPEDKRWLADIEKVLKNEYSPRAEDFLNK